MNCNLDFEWLLSYTSGELDIVQRVEFEAHLTECPVCTQRLAALRATESCMSEGLREPLRTPDLADSIMAQLPVSRKAPVIRWAWAGPCALAAGVAALGLFVWQSNSVQPTAIHMAEHKRPITTPHSAFSQNHQAKKHYDSVKPLAPETRLVVHSPKPRPTKPLIFVRRLRPSHTDTGHDVAKSTGTRGAVVASRNNVGGSSSATVPVIEVPVSSDEVYVVERPVPVNKHDSWRPPLESEVDDMHVSADPSALRYGG